VAAPVTSSPLIPRLLRLAWPTALARLGIMGMSVVDVMVVGQFASAELPYQALGWAPIAVLMVTSIGLLTGVQVLGARALGAGTPSEAGGAFRRGLVISAVAGLLSVAAIWWLGARLFTVFGISAELAVPSAKVARILSFSVPLHLFYVTTSFFLEAIQRPLASTIAMWTANALNLGLNLWLVPKLGAVGSAWCTVGARLGLAALLLGWVFRLPDAEELGVRQTARGPSYSALLRVGFAACVSHAAESGAFSGMTILAGRLGPEAVSAYQILLNLMAILFMASLGISSATAVLTSEAAGRGQPIRASRASFSGIGLDLALMLLAALLLLAFSGPIGHAYTANPALAGMVSGLLWLVALILPWDGGQVVAAAALRAHGQNWFPTASHLLAYAVVMPSVAYVLSEVRGQGVTGLMLSIFWASVLSFSVLCVRLWRIRARRDSRIEETPEGQN
jgi:MATE family multidrug resistance protein